MLLTRRDVNGFGYVSISFQRFSPFEKIAFISYSSDGTDMTATARGLKAEFEAQGYIAVLNTVSSLPA